MQVLFLGDLCLFISVVFGLRVGSGGDFFGQYGVVCAMCMWGVGVGLCKVVLVFASCSAILFIDIPMCDLTFCIVTLWVDHLIWWTIVDMSSLSRGFEYRDDGYFVWLFIR